MRTIRNAKIFAPRNNCRALLFTLLFGLVLVPSFALAAIVPVSILDNSFSPQSVTLNPGDTVVWTDYGSLAHTIAADNGSFSSNTITPGVNFSYTFNTPGVYGYYDRSYGGAGGVGMSGAVNVVGSVGAGSGVSGSLQTQAQTLLARIAALQAQLSGGGASVAPTLNSGACPNISRRLKLGSSGADVSNLQAFLAQYPTLYPEGLVTGYYGVHTQAAVQRFQAQNNVVSSGTPATTGYGVVGPRTAAAIGLLCSASNSNNSIPTTPAPPSNPSPTVGGTIQVTPITGSVPLTVSIVATLNTVSSCSGSTYVLNYGDASAPITIPTSPADCEPVVQTFSHTYSAVGTYTVALSASSHQTTARVTVTAPVQQPTVPADSMQASITSGVGPLAIVFTGTVSASTTLGCTGTCSDIINFGDGAISLVPIPTTGAWQSYLINHTYAAAGTYTAQLESVTGAPDGPSTTITVSAPPTIATTTSTTPPPPDSMHASIASGFSPLAVVFTGTVSAPTTLGCTGACSDLINFGDGAIGIVQIPAAGAWQAYIVNHTYATAGTYTAQLESVTGAPDGPPITIIVSVPPNQIATTTSTQTSTAPPDSMQASISSGVAPLAIVFTGTIAAPTALGCTGNCTDTINFGDGAISLIPIPAAGTWQSYAINHTYTAAGTYTAQFESVTGAHEGSPATITVSAPPKPVATTTSTQTSTAPPDSMHASIASGQAPLAVVFTGTVSSPTTLGCSGNCSDIINFGDGAIGLVPVPTGSGAWQTYVINHTYATAGTYTAQLKTVTDTPDGAPVTITVSVPANQVGGTYRLGTVSTVTAPYGISVPVSLPACGAYQVSWGDNSAATTGTGTCTAGGTTITVPHTYPTQAAGKTNKYTITLQNANGVTQGNVSTYTIST